MFFIYFHFLFIFTWKKALNNGIKDANVNFYFFWGGMNTEERTVAKPVCCRLRSLVSRLSGLIFNR